MNVHRIVKIAECARNNNGPGLLSTGEALTAALVLNRNDWLNAMDYNRRSIGPDRSGHHPASSQSRTDAGLGGSTTTQCIHRLVLRKAVGL